MVSTNMAQNFIIPSPSQRGKIPTRSKKTVLLHVIDVDLHGLPQGNAGLDLILRAKKTTLEANAWKLNKHVNHGFSKTMVY